MITDALKELEKGFHCETRKILFLVGSIEMAKYIHYFVDSELSRHSNNGFSLYQKCRNGYFLYNGTQIRIFHKDWDYEFEPDVTFNL